MQSNKIITAAGILLITGGILNGIYWLVMMGGGNFYSMLVICVPFLLMVAGGISTLRRKFWGLALAGAIFCLIFGIIAVFFSMTAPPILQNIFIRYMIDLFCSLLIVLTGLLSIISIALNKVDFKSR